MSASSSPPPAPGGGASGATSELASTNPAAFAAYQQLLPSELRSVGWVYQLRGNAPPLQISDVEGKSSIKGVACNPQDCTNDKVSYVIAADGSEAVAAVKTPSFNSGRMTLIGSSDSATEQLVLRMLLDFSNE